MGNRHLALGRRHHGRMASSGQEDLRPEDRVGRPRIPPHAGIDLASTEASAILSQAGHKQRPLAQTRESTTMSKVTESAVGQAAAVLVCLLMTGAFAVAQVGQGASADEGSLTRFDPVAGDNCPPGDPNDPATIGSWDLLDDLTEIMVVHAALLPTGKVLMFSGELEGGRPHLSILWDPITNEQTVQGPIVEDLFCAGHSHLADGRLLTIGGDGPVRTQTYAFDPWTETWTKLADMENGRWYPTGVTLGDGRVVAFSGWGGIGNSDEVEIWDPATEQWSTYPPSSNRDLEIYPGMHLMPNGKIFYSGTRWNGGQGWPPGRGAQDERQPDRHGPDRHV